MTPIYCSARKIPTTPPKLLEGIKKYNASPKGKQKRKEWLKKHGEKVKEYNRAYLAKRREQAKQAKICPHCFKNPSTEETMCCQECRKKAKEYAKKWKSKSK